ncbi:tRNA guanine-N 1 - -methyltransferase [Pyrenophora tritici-repentis]|nr:tRNA m(1)G methyltransferase domain-containing protein [Pyrenophora tritici-repentis]KAF7451701.1 tRNA mG methyltransferase domain containing protein [Pyrenophora tritici-repentis]KAG9386057.1 tRNA mG methyltransferase domain containing protein [Pyrenophora tritici-repentis]KAI1542943.1 tRNA guanine-N 1 - -methyltransferase [Pyrenophora tritici-repentis]KAI1555237.1 tRNA guanine-N 1 - -methyltransferase [Pyrenophora tritici-repentis]
MKERFDGILAKQYTSWKGFRFFEEDFVEVAEKAKEWMAAPEGGEVAGALKSSAENGDSAEEGEIVYLSSESDNVLTHLKPNSTYIIGGLVDKNRHKGICHKRAMERGIKTAKLPIGEYLEMKSRQVLVTNHVLEIMLKWMDFEDWGKAFMAVMPERKGAKLKGDAEDAEKEAEAAEAAAEESLDRDLADATREAEAGQDEPAMENSEAT